jgi:hypothetical protein
MATRHSVTSHGLLWRTALLALVVLPVLPEILVVTTSWIAQLHGCNVEDKAICVIGPVPSASSIIHAALKAGFLVGAKFLSGVAPLWLALCFVTITKGWSRLASRLALGFSVTLIFALVPYLGPMASIEPLLSPYCQPNEGGVGSCLVYGENIGGVAHENVSLASLFFIGAVMAFVTFSLYVLFLFIERLSQWKRAMPRVELRIFAHKL